VEGAWVGFDVETEAAVEAESGVHVPDDEVELI